MAFLNVSLFCHRQDPEPGEDDDDDDKKKKGDKKGGDKGKDGKKAADPAAAPGTAATGMLTTIRNLVCCEFVQCTQKIRD